MNGLYHCVCHDGHDVIVAKADAYQSDVVSLIITMRVESLQISGARYIPLIPTYLNLVR